MEGMARGGESLTKALMEERAASKQEKPARFGSAHPRIGSRTRRYGTTMKPLRGRTNCNALSRSGDRVDVAGAPGENPIVI